MLNDLTTDKKIEERLEGRCEGVDWWVVRDLGGKGVDGVEVCWSLEIFLEWFGWLQGVFWRKKKKWEV